MNPLNFCVQAALIVTGNGFVRQEPIKYTDVLVTATGVPITAASAPTAVVSGISWANAETGLLRLVIPGDYDQTKDYCKLTLIGSCATGAAGDTLSLGTSYRRYRSGGTAAGDVVNFVTAPAAKAAGITNTALLFDISGNSFQVGDVIELTITAANSGGSELITKGGYVRYKGCLAMFSKSDR